MPVRSIIARSVPGGYLGRYVHLDGEPATRVPLLLDLYGDRFGRDLAAMEHLLLTLHPAGWETLGRLRPALDTDRTAPGCYCHGPHRDPALRLTPREADPRWHAYVYVLCLDGLEVIAAHPSGHGWRRAVRIAWDTDPTSDLPPTLTARHLT